MDDDSSVTTTAESAGPAPLPARADFGLLLMVLIWGVNFSVVKTALVTLSPLAFNALRFPLAALMVFLVLWSRGGVRMPARADVPRVLLLGLLGNVVYQLFFIYGLDLTRAGIASLLLAATPIMTALLSAMLGHERVRTRTWLGVAAAVGGLSLVVLGRHGGLGEGEGSVLGELIMFGASASWAIYTVGARNLITRYGSVPVTAWTLWIGTVGLVLIGLPDVLEVSWTRVPLAAWVGVAYGGFLAIGLAYLLWYRGVGSVGNTRTATYSNLTPVVALVTAWLWLGEVPTPWQMAGALVAIGGVMLVQVWQ